MQSDSDAKPAILIVEDSAVLCKIATLSLQKYDVQIEVANDGIQAVEAVGRQNFDLILMDVAMPRMSGLEATMRIREMLGERHIPIVGVTASENRQNCLQAGMDDVLSKPADYHRIVEQWLPNVRRTDGGG